jgi:adenylate kinase family enzyme
MKRILIVGSAGAGKTTLACYLSQQLALPLIHLDQVFWQPGWLAPSVASWERLISQLIAQPTWILDGYYRNTLDMICKAADTIIFLDISRRRCIYRVCLRYLRNRLFRQRRLDLPNGCPERLRWSFLSWVWTFPQKQRPAILQTLQEVSAERQIVLIHNQAELVAWCSEVSKKTKYVHAKISLSFSELGH